MSYNITKWTTKRLEGFVIPLSILYDLSEDLIQRGWQPAKPKVTSMEDGIHVKIDGLGGGWVSGELLPDKSIAVDDICVYGEGSGTFYWDILKPGLRQSKGILEAILIWEGGDSISKLISNDGEISETDIEL